MTDKPEQFQLKWKAVAVVMIMVCASVLMTAHAMGTGTGGNSIPVVIESGSGVETASYIIYKDGDYTCAKNGTTGRITVRSENASYAIQTAIDSIDTGIVFITAGTYEIECWQAVGIGFPVYRYEYGGICINKSVSLIGAGVGITTLVMAPDSHSLAHPAVLIWGTEYNGLTIAHMTLDGDVDNQTIAYNDGAGLILTGGRNRTNICVHDLEVKNSPNYGIYLGNNGRGNDTNATVYNIYSHHNAQGGFHFDNMRNATISNIHCYYDGQSQYKRGIDIIGEYNWTRRNDNYRMSNIQLVDCLMAIGHYVNGVYISGLSIKCPSITSTLADLVIQSSENVTINADGFYRATRSGYAFNVVGSHNIVINAGHIYGKIGVKTETNSTVVVNGGWWNSDNVAFVVGGTSRLVVNSPFIELVSSTADYLFTIGDTSTLRVNGGASTSKGLIYRAAGATFIHRGTDPSMGLENRGSAIISVANSQITVAHGLMGTPSLIILTGSNNYTIDVYSKDLAATTFAIKSNIIVGVNSTVYWIAVYNP